MSEGRRCDFSTTSGLRNRRRHAHARTHAYTHNRVGLHTVTAGKEQQEKRHISPLHSPLGRVVGVLVGYSPEFTVKRKQWPRQNRSWHECTKNRRRNGTRSIGIQIGGDRSLLRFSNFRIPRGAPAIYGWSNERNLTRTRRISKPTILLFASSYCANAFSNGIEWYRVLRKEGRKNGRTFEEQDDKLKFHTHWIHVNKWLIDSRASVRKWVNQIERDGGEEFYHEEDTVLQDESEEEIS